MWAACNPVGHRPDRVNEDSNGVEPLHIRNPDGEMFALRHLVLLNEIARPASPPRELMKLNQGIFDKAVSLLSSATVSEIEREVGRKIDFRRFRPNLVIETNSARPFQEDDWVGSAVVFGSASEAASIAVTMRDKRCSMVNLDPDTAAFWILR